MSAPRLTSPTEVRELLRGMDFHPSKSLGQNFLIDANIRDRIVAEAEVSGKHVLEIGPGLGVLTEKLLEDAASVIAVEKDSRLHAWLRQRFEAGLELVHADALDVDLNAVSRSTVVSNLPYSVGNRILVRLIQHDLPERLVLTVQLDVADRICAEPRTKEYGALTVFVRGFYAVKKVHRIKPGCFVPAPSIDSAVLRLDRKPAPAVDRVVYMNLLKSVFSKRRKKLGTALNLPDVINDPGADVSQLRAEELPPEEWLRLFGKE